MMTTALIVTLSPERTARLGSKGLLRQAQDGVCRLPKQQRFFAGAQNDRTRCTPSL